MKKISCLLLGLFTTSIHAVCPDGKTYKVTLTFDDGPHAVLTPKVLDVLKEEKVPGTFFVLGSHFAGGKENPKTKTAYSLVERAKKEGHYIGSHTYEHLNHPSFGEETIKKNIQRTNPLLKDYLSPVLRLPYGAGSFRSSNATIQKKNDFIMKTVKEAGFSHVGWDVDTNDWDAKKRPTLLPTMLKNICATKGGVILFHDIQAYTVEHLQEWIQAIKKEGHELVALDDPNLGGRFKFSNLNTPLPPEVCGDGVAPKAVKELNDSVNKVIKKMK